MSVLAKLACGVLLFCAADAMAASALQNQLVASDGWVAYKLPILAGYGAPCCHDRGTTSQSAGCDLDRKSEGFSTHSDKEASGGLLSVYWHVRDGKFDELRAYAASCPVKSAREIRWLDRVDAGESVAEVSAWASGNPSTEKQQSGMALAVLAWHADARATTALEAFSADSNPRAVREEAMFWLGHARGSEGANFVERIANTDADRNVRAHAVFALSQSREKNIYERVHSIANQNSLAFVRGKALFWMAQMHDARAAKDIAEAIQSETSDDVREQAVFALSQLEGDAAAQALIGLIEGNQPREIKKKALFWLGQSESPKALEFLDRYLATSASVRQSHE